MADIPYHCPQCQNKRMVSEFADPTKIICKECDCVMTRGPAPAAPLDQPPASGSTEKTPPTQQAQSDIEPTQPGKKNKLKLAREKELGQVSDETAGVVKSKVELPEEKPQPLELHPKKKKKKQIITQPFLAFLLFLAVGGASGYVRYGINIEATPVGPYISYAWVVVLFLHVTIVLKALTDDMMQGIIAVFIPVWSFIYLAISDNYFYKAIIFGLLVGVGVDGGLQLLAFAGSAFASVQEFINTGGGNVRRN